MQFKTTEYNADEHDRWRALTVKQPYATNLVTVESKGGEHEFALKSIEVRSKKTSYRGELMICSAASPEIYGLESGVTLGIVELYDVKPVKKFTPDDWENTTIPENERHRYKNGWGWMMRNPRRVVEHPVKGQLGIYNLVYSKDLIVEYPRAMVIDKESRKLLNKQANERK